MMLILASHPFENECYVAAPPMKITLSNKCQQHSSHIEMKGLIYYQDNIGSTNGVFFK